MQDNFNKKFLELIDKENYVEARNLWVEQTPNYVYKYFRLGQVYDDLTLSNLENKKIYFNHVTQYDDKNEFKNVFYRNTTKLAQEQKNYEIARQINNNIISCFCGEVVNENKMWDDYANKGIGFRCKFNVIDKSCVIKVIYSNKKYYIEEIQGNLEEQKTKIERNIFLKKLSYYLKNHNDWREQNEYRIILDCENTFPLIDKIIYPGGYVLCNNFLELESIVIGDKVNNITKNKLFDMCQQMNIKCYEREL